MIQEPAQPAGHSPLGLAMMIKAGWKPGQGLGPDPAGGLKAPLMAMLRLDRTCIGHDDAVQVQAQHVSHHPHLTRSGEKRSRKQRDKLRHSFPPEVQKDSQYGAWDGNVARLPCCKFDPSHRVALRKLKEHEARCPANPARLSKQS